MKQKHSEGYGRRALKLGYDSDVMSVQVFDDRRFKILKPIGKNYVQILASVVVFHWN